MGNACPLYSQDPLLLYWAFEGLTLAELARFPTLDMCEV